MKLSYRGTSYEYNPAQDLTVESAAPTSDLKYRGASYRRGQAARAESLSALVKYRGAAYGAPRSVVQSAPSQVVAAPVAAAPGASIQEQARLLTTNHYRHIKNRQQTMLSRSAAEVGLVGNLAKYWNHIQGQIHPTFRLNYDRSSATLS